MKKIIIAYVPVLHEGYRKFFESHKDAETLFVFGPEIISEFDYLAKEIRALDPNLAKRSVQVWGIFEEVEILSQKSIEEIRQFKPAIIMPDEDVCRSLAEKYFGDCEVIFDKIFLRWDKHNSVEKKPITADKKISKKDFDKKIMDMAAELGKKSSDWWRGVGVIVVKDGKIIFSDYNHHVPSDHTPYANGDPRNAFHKGINLELSTVIHAESRAISEAAKNGISLDGAEMYVSTFPCPPCAKAIAYSGIKKIYYRDGYGVLDGESVLRQNGIEIIFVE